MPVPQIDFSPLGDLYNTYRQSQQQATRDQVLGGLAQGGGPLNYGDAARQLLAAGDTQGGMSLAQLAQQQYLTSPEYIEKIARTKAQVEQDFGPKTVDIKTPGPFGDTTTQTVERGPNGFRPLTMQPATGGQGTTGTNGLPQSGLFNKGVSSINSELSGDAYLNQFSPEVQAAVKSYLDGRSNPVSNPRKGFAEAVKVIGQKYGADIGIPADDASIGQRRTMLNDLAKTTPGSAGGQITFARTSINHLASVAEAAEALKNYDLGLTPLSGAVNSIRGLTTDQAAKVAALQDAAQHYGQEVTKFYAGSPGGEGERTRFLTALSGAKTPTELSSVIEAEMRLIPERLGELKNRMDNVLGQSASNFPTESAESVASLNKINKALARMRGQPEPADIPAPATSQRPQLQPQNPNAWQNPQTISAARADPQGALAQARQAIQSGKDPQAVAKRLQQIGIDPSPLFGGQPGFASPGQRQ